jgi:hypothetical protein
MVTLICAGGSGARVLEAVLHLCAAGLGPDHLRAFVIDPDGTNGNLERTTRLVELYAECQGIFAEPNQPFFRTTVDLMGNEGLRVWSPVKSDQKFGALLNYDGLTDQQREIAHLFFTKNELDMPMNVGFQGHPALGAAALSLLPLYKRNDPLWSRFGQAIEQEVTLGETKVVIVGSVFGGTGASAIHPVVRHLRGIPQANRERLKIAAVALVPYFRFSAAEADSAQQRQAAAQSEWFSLASRSAAEYYRHLEEHNDWEFDAMYWLGDDSPMRVSYSVGGPDQKNPAHFVDLLAAFAFLHFTSTGELPKGCYYSGPQEVPTVPNENVLAWDDIPAASPEQRKVWRDMLHHFHLVGAAHLGFYGPLTKDPRLKTSPHCVPWYLEQFVNKGLTLVSTENQEKLAKLTEYFEKNYFPWWNQVHVLQKDRVRLLNKMAWLKDDGQTIQIKTNHLANLMYPDENEKHSLDAVNDLFEGTVRYAGGVSGTKNPCSKYLAILGRAAQEVAQHENQGAVSA